VDKAIRNKRIRPPARKAVDARLVKSASRPLSSKELKEEREKRESGERLVDRNGNLIKFCRDLDSDWSVPCGIRNVLCLCYQKP